MTSTRLAATLFPLLLAFACKEASVPRDGDDASGDVVSAHRSSGTAEFYASDVQYLQKNANFFFNVWNQTFTRRLDDLPATGEVPDDKKPYSGGYYAEGDGGTDQVMVGGKSPLQKYDDAFYQGQNKSSAWERDKHTSGPEWAGHCNGFAATAQRHPKEPSRNVVRNGVTFAPQDIKALLAEIHMNADYEFLGGNRCEQATPPTPGTRADPTVMGDCEDINPGTMHAAITNWIGRMHHTLVMDSYAGDQVWNYPLYKYQVLQKDYITAAQAAQQVVGGGTYKFNPSAVKFALIHMKLTYAEALRKEVLGQMYPKDMDLQYVLELDANGEIIGGEWVGAASQKTHPDFLWVALEPLTPNGTRFMGNQYLDNNEVIKMWAESVGADPNNPPLDIKRPAGTSEWGKWPGFDVSLDGSRTGAVFAGKQIIAHIARHEGLDGGGVAVDVLLNGAELKTLTASANEDLTLAFDPGIGLNRLEFIWKKDGAQIDDEFLRFHVVR